MQDDPTEMDIREALETCASEPVHAPGLVQPIGVLLAFNASDMTIEYVSENSADILEHPPAFLLGKQAEEILGREIWHAFKNAQAYSLRTRELLGNFVYEGKDIEVNAFESGTHFVVELEPVSEKDQPTFAMMRTMEKLTSRIQSCDTQDVLFATTVNLLRHLTGYDRVMLYQFDKEFNGQIVAEDKRTKLEPFLGLRFPHWDIPSQARDIMRVVPLRFIADVDREPVGIMARNTELAPLDITQSQLRGVSPIHMQYLRNMGSQATMTLSIMLGKDLWGIISFHHSRPKTPALRDREVLRHFLNVFVAKMTILLQNHALQMIDKIDLSKEKILTQINDSTDEDQTFSAFAPILLDIFQAGGAASLSETETLTFGKTPGKAVLQKLLAIGVNRPPSVVATDDLASLFPEAAQDLNGLAGALIAAITPSRAMVVFRHETAQQIAWAGNPNKTITDVDGQKRLEPRGSFATYLQQVQGRSDPWTDEDHFFARRLWAILYTSERRGLLNRERRQQDLMINELNHRVRNILALVRSVSRQARKKYGSLTSYSRSLEARIQALAAAHQIGSGSARQEVSIKEILHVEAAPYDTENWTRVSVLGVDQYIRAELAPIFALIIHELVTNAAKYGALSNSEGSVTITLSMTEVGLSLIWRERGGPRVIEPDERGFGSALIEQAVPHELNGGAVLNFLPEGVEADIWLPFSCLLEGVVHGSPDDVPYSSMFDPELSEETPLPMLSGEVMLVEDNFLIATDMSDVLSSLGFDDVSVLASVEAASEYLDVCRPNVAVLDVNLGNETTSLPIAHRLLALDVPFFFVTGYGDRADLPEEFANIPKLAKPLEVSSLRQVIKGLRLPVANVEQ